MAKALAAKMAVALSFTPLVRQDFSVEAALSLHNLQHTRAYAPHLRAKIAHGVAKAERRAAERRRRARSRPVCDGCSRPPALCVCGALPGEIIRTATRILVLQHPNERRKRNFSTVPLLSLVLGDVTVRAGYSFEAEDLAPVMDALGDGQTPLLLFPGPGALSLDDPEGGEWWRTEADGAPVALCPDALEGIDVPDGDGPGSGSGQLLILIDGTWAEARRMARESPSLLSRCRRVQFAAASSSVYAEMRSEPEGHCLSTLEACARALTLLEPPGSPAARRAPGALRAALRAHVDAHLANALSAEPRFRAEERRARARDRRRREIERDLFGGGGGSSAGGVSGKGGGASVGSSAPAGAAIEAGAAALAAPRRLPDGATLRPLRASDAPLVDSWWEKRRSATSLFVARRIEADGGVACLGVEADGRLRGCIVRYEGGALGMLYVEVAYRRRGYGAALLGEATRAMEELGEERVAFILDGNEASEALFSGQGWVRADPSLRKRTGKRCAKRRWIKP